MCRGRGSWQTWTFLIWKHWTVPKLSKLSPYQRISCVLHVELVTHCTYVDHLIYHIPVCYIAASIRLVALLTIISFLSCWCSRVVHLMIVVHSEVHPVCHCRDQILSIQLLRQSCPPWPPKSFTWTHSGLLPRFDQSRACPRTLIPGYAALATHSSILSGIWNYCCAWTKTTEVFLSQDFCSLLDSLS